MFINFLIAFVFCLLFKISTYPVSTRFCPTCRRSCLAVLRTPGRDQLGGWTRHQCRDSGTWNTKAECLKFYHPMFCLCSTLVCQWCWGCLVISLGGRWVLSEHLIFFSYLVFWWPSVFFFSDTLFCLFSLTRSSLVKCSVFFSVFV